jgi:exodeoxyribonuclease VII large subunit
MEDLWAFNDEQVARSIFEAIHPIIVGVGHETDFTIADFVADLRASTPSAAAELAVPDSNDISKSLSLSQMVLSDSMAHIVATHSTRLEILGNSLVHLSPHSMVNNNLQKVDWLSSRLDQAAFSNLRDMQNRYSIAQTALEGISPLATLARGYAIVQGQDGHIIHSVDGVSSGDRLNIRVSDGDFKAKAE